MGNSNNEKKGKPGRKSRKPICVIYKTGDNVTAALVSPINDQVREETATGPYAALGQLKDQGYDFGEITSEVPDWVNNKIPKKATLVGVANITGFPL